MLSRKQRLFLFLVNTREVSEKSKDITLELNCDAPVEGLIKKNVHVCKSNKLI